MLSENLVQKKTPGQENGVSPAIGFDRAHLHARSVLGHYDERGDLAPRRSAGYRGSVIAARLRDDAMRGFFFTQREDGIAGATDLERACFLQVFALEEEARAGHGIERRGSEHRGAMDSRTDAAVSVENGLPG